MEKFGRSQSTKRFEDTRFLTGQGRYVDNIAPSDALHAFVFRSPVAHAEITALDVSEARDSDGVHAVITVHDLEAAGIDIDLKGVTVQNKDGSNGASPMRPLLAKDKVRFVGEAIAVIIADTLEQARDASELIEFDFDELPAHMELASGGTAIHEVAQENVAFDWGMGDEEAAQKVFETAAHVVSLDVADNRIIVNSMEPRGCYAEWDGTRLHVCVNGQGVWVPKSRLTSMLNLQADNVRVTNPDVGGGFGMKAMTYPETYVVAHAAMVLGRPVRWMSERTEAMLSDNAGRDLVSKVEAAFDESHKMVAYRVHTDCNMGAYNSQFAQAIQTSLFSKVLMGCYDVQTTWLSVKGYFTNTTQVDAYRGAGRPEAIYVLERLMDHAARSFGMDPWDLRRKNFILAEAFPYTSATGETYDVGDFHRVLDRIEITSDRAGFDARKAQSEASGKLRGLGLCYYIESILGDPSETATVEFQETGRVHIYVGTQSNGQGHETVYAQFLSDQTGIPVEFIDVIQGDSDLIAHGGGTGGSRSVTVQNTATLATVDKMITAFIPFVADQMGVAADQVEFDHDTFRAVGSNMTPTLLEMADKARQEERSELLRHSERITLDARSFPNGAHVAEVEIDPETGVVRVDRYTVVDDFGNLINPMLAEGQVHGGIAQGIGQALQEHVVYDEDGQLLTATFMDYAMPLAKDLPFIKFDTEPVPSTTNPMGMKGCGEAGTVGALAAVANAVQDAVWDHGIRQVDMPLTPHRVWELLKSHELAAE